MIQKWEYAFVRCEPRDDGLWQPRYVNGKEIQLNPEEDMVAFTNRMGGEGWELLHIHIDTIGIIDKKSIQRSQETAYRLYFKRSRE